MLETDDITAETFSSGLLRRLPSGWDVKPSGSMIRGVQSYTVSSVFGERGRLLVRDVGGKVEARQVASLARRFAEVAGEDGVGAGFVVVAPFIGRRVRDLLTGEGIGYSDSTGNMRIVLERPAVFIEAVGADRLLRGAVGGGRER